MRERRMLAGVVVLFLGVFACRGNEAEKAEAPPAATATMAPAAVPTAPPTVEPSPTAAPSPTVEPTPEATPEAEEESAAASDLQLLGIVRAGTPSAVIAYQGEQEIFRKGDSVFDHGTVKEVRDDSVVLRAGGKDVTLKLAAPEPVPQASPPAEEVVPGSTAPVVPPPANEPLSRGEVRTALKNFSSVLESAEAKRVSIGGRHGVELAKVEPSSFLAKLGLRSGDVLQEIGDKQIQSVDELPDLSGEAEGKQLEIRFTRDDVSLTVARPIQ